ncbi:MAG: SMP-30/gluconolactonase/LRE family protein [Verrucomicrobiota bacterium]
MPDAIVDLRSLDGAARVQGTWRYSDTQIQEIDHRDVGADLTASGPKNRSYDFTPDARAARFDDRAWPLIPANSLETRRGHGRLSFNWYRLHLTVPAELTGFSTAGSTIIFELVVDDYAEVWVNDKAPYVLGQSGGAVAAGWNAPNRVVLTRDAQPGQEFRLAILGINGPISTHPDTYIWIRSATLDFYAPGKLNRSRPAKLVIERFDPELDAILPQTPALEKLADGFAFTEGPVWVPGGMGKVGPDASEGFLLFSDPNNNLIYRMTEDGEASVFMTKSGYSGLNIGEYHQPGSNGLTLDPLGRLTICQHGNRQVVRVEKNGLRTVMAERYDGKRLNSPNDLVYRSDGMLFFTDPPFGLPKGGQDPRRELPHAGIYAVQRGEVELVSSALTGPNGIAFSPDERFLYVGNWDEKRKVVLRFPVTAAASLGNPELFFDMTSAPGSDAIDGIKVDERGHVYVSGPGGLWVLSPEENTWERFAARNTRITWPGAARTGARFTSLPRLAFIASALIWPEQVLHGERGRG